MIHSLLRRNVDYKGGYYMRPPIERIFGQQSSCYTIVSVSFHFSPPDDAKHVMLNSDIAKSMMETKDNWSRCYGS
ncbi:hypothetical protein K7X08_024750 [Anisodus acutangulus]|uniref:Uncharacterized protein n=1 Tax=Anisodus acutangulus TaxID=402998 RepID=A0A9Q1MC68_9SOLA|nr:hypothetical protein K7X08_024750 [Anisodus acutangulus]